MLQLSHRKKIFMLNINIKVISIKLYERDFAHLALAGVKDPTNFIYNGR